MKTIRIICLKWKRRQIVLEIEQLIIQVHHSPELENRLYELELQLKSINEYLK